MLRTIATLSLLAGLVLLGAVESAASGERGVRVYRPEQGIRFYSPPRHERSWRPDRPVTVPGLDPRGWRDRERRHDRHDWNRRWRNDDRRRWNGDDWRDQARGAGRHWRDGDAHVGGRCHRIWQYEYNPFGNDAKFGATQCYDRFGGTYIVPGSRFRAR